MVNAPMDPTPKVPRAAGLECPSCGAGLPMSSMGWAVTIACTSCGSVLDALDPNLAILQRHELRMRVPPKIPLGTRGTWHGTVWEAIGVQEVTITVDETDYSWTEYVLFNPYKGFLYLSEYMGHWNVIEKLHVRPMLGHEGGRPMAMLEGRAFKHFQTADARTTFAAGEFPWEVRLGDTVMSRDYVAPPFILSAEASAGETTWSLGSYTPGNAIATAFGVGDSWPRASGVFANQPNPHTARAQGAIRACGVLVGALVLMFVANVVMSSSSLAHQGSYQFRRAADAETEAALVTEPFTLTGRPSNVEIELDTDLDNDWVFYSLALVNEGTGDTRDASKQLSYFSGTDSDGRWTEGSRRGKVKVASVPSGTYFLRIGTAGGEPGKSVVNYQLRVRRDVPSYLFYFFALLALTLPALFLFIPATSFEQRRWAESDHAPVASSEDDDE